jgi:hypothetical protein
MQLTSLESRARRYAAPMLKVLVVAALVAMGGAGASAAPARTPLLVGAVAPELLDPTLAESTIGLLREANLGDVARVTVTWQRGQTVIDPGLLSDLGTGVAQAGAAGVDVYLDVYPNGSSQTPRTASAQNDFATWVASIVEGVPTLRSVIVGNESNLNLFWMPQFGRGGQDLAAPSYEHLLAKTYDAVKQVAPKVQVYGGALAHSGTDRPGTGRDTHSPTTFIVDMGKAYRASGRTRPIMDGFAYHPYMERSDLPPTMRHDPRSKTLTIADYGRLVSALGRAFDGTKQKGTKLPLVYDEFGVEATVPASQRAGYTEKEPRTTHPVAEAVQAKYYADGLKLASCQPTVKAFMVFRLVDSPFLSSWQSGVYYQDRQTPKSSLSKVAAATRRARTSAPAGCARLLAPRAIVDWKKRTILCDADCRYVETYVRRPGGRIGAMVRGTATASVAAKLRAPKRIRSGSYRIVLRVTAIDYAANAFVASSPPVTVRR